MPLCARLPPQSGGGLFNPFFATANAAFRREALLEIDGFDRQCQTGEDVDVSIRLSRAGWELWVLNPPRLSNTRSATRSTTCCGNGSATAGASPGYSRSTWRRRGCEFYVAGDPVKNPRPYGAKCVLDVPFFCYGLIFLSAYYLFHAALLALIIGAIAHSSAVSMGVGVIAVASGLYYATIRFNWRRPLRSIGMLGLRYAADTAFVAGALIAGLRYGVVLLGATRTR